MKQLNEMQGFDANFTELKNYDDIEENNGGVKVVTTNSSNNSENTYYEQMESPYGVTIQKSRNSSQNNAKNTVSDEELNCGIM
jgi:hypothetical protein